MTVRNKTDILLIFDETFPFVTMILLHYSSLVWLSSQAFVITGSLIL